MKKYIVLSLIISAGYVGAQYYPYGRGNPQVLSVVPTTASSASSLDTNTDYTVKSITTTGSGQSIFYGGLATSINTNNVPFSDGTNWLVDFNYPVTDITPTNNVYFLYSTNFTAGAYGECAFFLKGSSSNYTVNFGTDFTNLFGSFTTNGYKLTASNGVHIISFGIRGARGKTVIAISAPNN